MRAMYRGLSGFQRMIEIFGHTADIRLRVSGNSLEALFREALRGTINLLHPQKGTRRTTRDVIFDAADATVLLIDFLNEALSSENAHRETYDDAVFSKLTETHVAATLTGCDALEFGEDVKAVTYHEAEVRRSNDGTWSTMLVFDL